ncbi:MAG: sigma-70 family RNA polymerase sigma factor, partial [Acidimicrobiales bacterium]
DLTALAISARSGHDEATRAFIAAAYPEVWRFCASLVDPESAEDLAQDTFVRALRTLRRYRGDASARTWLLAVARNTCYDHLRALVRQRGHEASLTPIQTATVAGPAGQVELVTLLARLAPERRSAFVLTQVLGMSYHDAATICGCPVGTIRSRVARARAELITAVAEGESTASDPEEDRPLRPSDERSPGA